MKTTILTAILVAGFGAIASAQQEDPFREIFFPPEIVVHHAEDLGISDADRDKFRQDLESRKAAFEKAGAAQHAASEALADVLKGHPIDADAALKKFDAMIAAENAMKRLHVEAMISVRNQLTTEQVAKVNELKRGPQFNQEEQKFIHANIEPKMKEFQEAMRAREQAQNPPPEEVPHLMDQFHKAMEAKKLEVAAKALNEAVALVK